MDTKSHLLSVIHDHALLLVETCAPVENFVSQGISEIQKAEVRLQNQFENITPPLDEITLHDLRSPLNLIIGFAEVLLEEVDNPLTPSQHDALLTLLNTGIELSEYIDQHYENNDSSYVR